MMKKTIVYELDEDEHIELAILCEGLHPKEVLNLKGTIRVTIEKEDQFRKRPID